MVFFPVTLHDSEDGNDHFVCWFTACIRQRSLQSLLKTRRQLWTHVKSVLKNLAGSSFLLDNTHLDMPFLWSTILAYRTISYSMDLTKAVTDGWLENVKPGEWPNGPCWHSHTWSVAVAAVFTGLGPLVELSVAPVDRAAQCVRQGRLHPRTEGNQNVNRSARHTCFTPLHGNGVMSC